MATLNGYTSPVPRPTSPMSHLGKRKRTTSPQPKVESQDGSDSLTLSKDLQTALQIIHRHDPSGLISRQSLPPRSQDSRSFKRQRKEFSGKNLDNIEDRILNNVYDSLAELMEDLGHLNGIDGIATTNGHAIEAESIWKALTQYREKIDTMDNVQPESIPTDELLADVSENRVTKQQIVSLRSQTENGVRQLFSGLPQISEVTAPELDGRKLPKGFEITTATTIDTRGTAKDSRTFGEVFAPHRTTKGLEAPRLERRNRDTIALSFVPPFSNPHPTSKIDYKYTSLSTGSWLKYSTNGCGSTSNTDSGVGTEPDDSTSLFKAAFSSFAPTTDYSNAIVVDSDRARQWWRGFTARKTAIILPIAAQSTPDLLDDSPHLQLEDDFEKILDNFVSEADLDNEDESQKLLDEVSELLQTLSSYQTIRASEPARGPSSANKPTKPEADIYEILKSQLQILVSSLPPFAVAKLNGKQLEDLNVSTNIFVDPPEYHGTSHADEYSLRRIKAAQTVASAAGRSIGSVPSRNTYATPTAGYNAQAQAYNRNVSATAYASRPNPNMYNTPRNNNAIQNPPYTQPNYRAGQPPTIQQLQRQAASGYQAGLPSAPNYMQRPSQTGFQQRPQDPGPVYGRSDPQQKPLVNGQNVASPQVRQNPVQLANYTTIPINQQSAMSQPLPDTPRPQQQPTQQRQSSSTPQPQYGVDSIQQAPVVANTM